MSQQRSRQRDDRAWDAAGALHPGVRHPRARQQGQWSALTDGLIIAFAGLLVLVAMWSAWSASPVGPVREWVGWRAQGMPLSVEHPAGWRATHFTRAGILYVTLTRSEWVRVHIIAGPDIARAGWMPGVATDSDAYRALALLHEDVRDVWTDLFGGMQEGRAARAVLGDRRAVWSEFSYSDGLFEGPRQQMTGYRATLVGSGQGVLIAAVAPATSRAEFQPIALHILRSVRIGG